MSSPKVWRFPAKDHDGVVETIVATEAFEEFETSGGKMVIPSNPTLATPTGDPVTFMTKGVYQMADGRILRSDDPSAA